MINSNIKPYTIQRISSQYHDQELKETYKIAEMKIEKEKIIEGNYYYTKAEDGTKHRRMVIKYKFIDDSL